jgi:hypothetical protein
LNPNQLEKEKKMKITTERKLVILKALKKRITDKNVFMCNILDMLIDKDIITSIEKDKILEELWKDRIITMLLYGYLKYETKPYWGSWYYSTTNGNFIGGKTIRINNINATIKRLKINLVKSK